MIHGHIIDDTMPTCRCPKCGYIYADYDGLGVMKCNHCDYCKHLAKGMNDDGNWVCDYCGKIFYEHKESKNNIVA